MESTGSPDIQLSGLTKRFGDFTAVDSIDLEVAHGEFFTLLGPSGSGKTTTLRMIAGFELPDEGRVELGGQDVTDTVPARSSPRSAARCRACGWRRTTNSTGPTASSRSWTCSRAGGS